MNDMQYSGHGGSDTQTQLFSNHNKNETNRQIFIQSNNASNGLNSTSAVRHYDALVLMIDNRFHSYFEDYNSNEKKDNIDISLWNNSYPFYTFAINMLYSLKFNYLFMLIDIETKNDSDEWEACQTKYASSDQYVPVVWCKPDILNYYISNYSEQYNNSITFDWIIAVDTDAFF